MKTICEMQWARVSVSGVWACLGISQQAYIACGAASRAAPSGRLPGVQGFWQIVRAHGSGEARASLPEGPPGCAVEKGLVFAFSNKNKYTIVIFNVFRHDWKLDTNITANQRRMLE